MRYVTQKSKYMEDYKHNYLFHNNENEFLSSHKIHSLLNISRQQFLSEELKSPFIFLEGD